MDKTTFEHLMTARRLYSEGRFREAMEHRDAYVSGMRPASPPVMEHGGPDSPEASVVIVAYRSGRALLDCIDALLGQRETVFEIIVVDNGGNDDLSDALAARPLRLLRLPENVGPSEARNLGVLVSRSELILFLDDDAEPAPDFVSQAVRAFTQYDFIAIRGRILPRSPKQSNLPGHYDLGAFPMPAVLETEGAMAVRKPDWDAVGGMDPMLFGAEGVELTARLLERFPGRDVYYWPLLVIRHDYAEGDGLARKKQRHGTAARYFKEFNAPAARLAALYGRWYQARPGTTVRYDQRSLIQKGLAAFRELYHARSATMDKGDAAPMAHEDRPAVPPVEHLSREQLARRVRQYGQRMQLLEQNLRTIRESAAYGLGRLAADMAGNPLGAMKRQASAIARLARNAATGSQSATRAPDTTRPGFYTNPGRETHRCTSFPKADIHAPRQRTSARVGCLLPDYLTDCLSFDARCSQPSRDAVDQWLERERPEVFIAGPLHDGRADMVADVYEACRRRGVPTACWCTGDAALFKEIAADAARADFVFADTPAMAALAERELPNYAGLLLPAIQPALHNPLRSQRDGQLPVTDKACCDGWADLLEYPERCGEFLAPLLPDRLDVLESRWELMANKLDDLPVWRNAVRGCLDGDELRSALRSYPVLVQAQPSLSSAPVRTRRLLEAIGCGASVVAADPDGLLQAYGLPDRACRVLDPGQDLRRAVEELILSGEEREKAVHVARRHLYEAHTYAHRLASIFTAAGLKHPWTPPLATLVTPTKRPHRLEACLRQHAAQTHPATESIVVLNNTDCDVDAVRSLCDRYGARMIVLPEECTIGQCLNEAIRQARGVFWLKIDDDDFYGPNYVRDTVHAWQMSGADILGKAAGHVYFEESDELCRRDEGDMAAHVICAGNKPHISGATLAGSTERHALHPFPEDKRACVDSLFFEQNLENGVRIHMTDQWNFVAFRGKDKNDHTWRLPDQRLKSKATVLGGRDDIEKRMI